MKWFGAFLLLVSGYLLSRRLAEPGIRHVELLEEGEYLFRPAGIGDQNAKIPLPELFADISRRTGSLWKGFFADLSEEMKEERDFAFGDEFERLLTFHLSEILTKKSCSFFCGRGEPPVRRFDISQKYIGAAFPGNPRTRLRHEKTAGQPEKGIPGSVSVHERTDCYYLI